MPAGHSDVLADIERRVRTDDPSPDEVDRRIADELGVPLDYYFAYLLVWGAIEAYREARDLAETQPSGDPRAAVQR